MTIDEIRQDIDALDDSLLELLSRRAEKVLEIGRLKEQTQRAVFDRRVERRILDRLNARNRGPLSQEAVEGIFGAIIAAHRVLEKQLTIAYYGPAGTFTHLAARKEVRPRGDAALRFHRRRLRRGGKERGRPRGRPHRENSTGGVVPYTLDALVGIEAQTLARRCTWISSSTCSPTPLLWRRSSESTPILSRCNSPRAAAHELAERGIDRGGQHVACSRAGRHATGLRRGGPGTRGATQQSPHPGPSHPRSGRQPHPLLRPRPRLRAAQWPDKPPCSSCSPTKPALSTAPWKSSPGMAST